MSLSALHRAASEHADRPHRQARRAAQQAEVVRAAGATLHAGHEHPPGVLHGRYQTTVAASAHVLPGMVTSWLPGQNQGTTPVVAGRRRLLQSGGMAVLTQARLAAASIRMGGPSAAWAPEAAPAMPVMRPFCSV